MKKTIIIRLFAALCAVAMLSALVACGGAPNTPKTKETAAPETSAAASTTEAAPVTESAAPASTPDEPTKEPTPKATYTVSFNTLGGSEVASLTVTEGEHASKPADPTKEGAIFGGWAKDEAGTQAYDFDAETVTGNLTLFAVWEDASDSSTATFHLNYEGAEDVFATKVFANGARISKPDVPTREGCKFGGWYTDTSFTEAYSEMKKYTGNQDFYAKWLVKFTLEAENTKLTDLDPEEDETATTSGNKIGYGRSGESHGTGMISKSTTASGGSYVHGLYYNGAFLAFEIKSDKAVSDAQIVVRLSAEFKDYELTKDDLAIEVNGKAQKYNTTISLKQDQPFADYMITTTASLVEGDNLIRLVVVNDERQFPDGTVYAAAPMVDCVYLFTTANITMTRYNTSITDQ